MANYFASGQIGFLTLLSSIWIYIYLLGLTSLSAINTAEGKQRNYYYI